MAVPATTGINRNQRAPKLWDIQEVAERLGVQVRHVRRLVNERRIPFIKWGHLLRFDPGELDAWVDAARVGTVAAHHRGIGPASSSARTRR